MYCPYCNSLNPDDSRFCSNCGAALNTYSGGNQYSGQSYGQQTYNQNFNNIEPTPPMTVATPIIAIIINVVFPNILALIFGILSLVYYNRYESDIRSGNIASAEMNKQKAKKDAKIAIVLAIILGVLEIAAIIGFMTLGFIGGAEIIGDEMFEGFAMISTII